MTAGLTQLLDLLAAHGAIRFYAKKLAPNDNSKNQIYLGGGFAALNVIPHGEIYIDRSALAGAKQDRPKAPVRFFWLDADGLSEAPGSQLVLYPDYPEVRMSGFLRGAERPPSALMTSRDAGRILFFGVTPDGRVLAAARGPQSPEAVELLAREETLPLSGVFLELSGLRVAIADPRQSLLAALAAIHRRGWIPSQKLDRYGVKRPYQARNGGGYTLEAELGISPNGRADPDYLGWEVKQYGVGDFVRFQPESPVTLMTPEPTGGFYRTSGVEAFLHRYGYADKSGKAGRINFGGTYTVGKPHHADTGLTLTLPGFDAATGEITDFSAGLALVDRAGDVAASWSYTGIIGHWNHKHAKAAYVPSQKRDTLEISYWYGPRVLLCEGTDVLLFMAALAGGTIYYDPGIKLEPGASSPKRRSQFRIRQQQLPTLYHTAVTEILP